MKALASARRAVGSVLVAIAVVGCSSSSESSITSAPSAADPTVDPATLVLGEPAIILWDTSRGMAGQVVVEVTNESDGWVHLNPSGDFDAQTLEFPPGSTATVFGPDGQPVTGTIQGSRNDLNGYPSLLKPGDTGILVGQFDYRDVSADDVTVKVDYRFGVADPPPLRADATFSDTKVDQVRGDEIEVSMVIDLNGESSVTFAGVAYDDKGRILGFVEGDRLRRVDGEFSLCCLPPNVKPKSVDEVRYFAG